jgi:hypothetical protein
MCCVCAFELESKLPSHAICLRSVDARCIRLLGKEIFSSSTIAFSASGGWIKGKHLIAGESFGDGGTKELRKQIIPSMTFVVGKKYEKLAAKTRYEHHCSCCKL